MGYYFCVACRFKVNVILNKPYNTTTKEMQLHSEPTTRTKLVLHKFSITIFNQRKRCVAHYSQNLLSLSSCTESTQLLLLMSRAWIFMCFNDLIQIKKKKSPVAALKKKTSSLLWDVYFDVKCFLHINDLYNFFIKQTVLHRLRAL